MKFTVLARHTHGQTQEYTEFEFNSRKEAEDALEEIAQEIYQDYGYTPTWKDCAMAYFDEDDMTMDGLNHALDNLSIESSQAIDEMFEDAIAQVVQVWIDKDDDEDDEDDDAEEKEEFFDYFYGGRM
jgi:hypothetical protein